MPKLGKLPVGEITQTDIRDCLAPLWHAKADTARKALSRLSICLRHAAALGLDVDLQTPDKARALLGKSRRKVQNIPAMRWQEVPAFYASLNDGSITHLSLCDCSFSPGSGLLPCGFFARSGSRAMSGQFPAKL